MLGITPSSSSSRSKKSSSSKRDALASGKEKLAVNTFTVIRRVESSSPRTPFTSQAPECPADTLKMIIGDKGRRSRCAPEFLQEVALAKRVQFDLLEDLGRKFKIIAGKEAVGFYKRFLKGKRASPDKGPEELSPPVVFAVTVTNAGRRLVDYYLTWRGQTRAHELRGSKRKVDFLDSEFRKVARSLDKEFKRASVYGSVTSVAGSTNSARQEFEGPSENTKPRLQTIVIPQPATKTESPSDVPPPPHSATDSVTSLPVLSYVRGVPFGNRKLLTVTNPDRLSTISSDSVQNFAGNPAHPNNVLTSVTEEPATDAPSPLVTVSPPGRTETPSSRSTSPQSEASINPANASSSKEELKSDDKASSEFLIVLLDETIDKNGSTWHGLERQTSRSSARSLPTRISPWDGPLARAHGITYRTPPLRRVSSTKAKAKAKPGAPDDSSSDEEEWENEPVIPLEPYIVPALPSEPPPPSRVASPASMSMNMQYGPGAMPTLSVPYASPMVSVHNLNMGYPSLPAYGSPYMQAQANHLPPVVSSPYVSPYMSPNVSLHRSLSQSPYAGYSSPYVS